MKKLFYGLAIMLFVGVFFISCPNSVDDPVDNTPWSDRAGTYKGTANSNISIDPLPLTLGVVDMPAVEADPDRGTSAKDAYVGLTLSIGGKDPIPLGIPSAMPIAFVMPEAPADPMLTIAVDGDTTIKFSMNMPMGETEADGFMTVEGTFNKTDGAITGTTWATAVGEYTGSVKMVSSGLIPAITLHSTGSVTVPVQVGADEFGNILMEDSEIVNFGELGFRTGQMSADVNFGPPSQESLPAPKITLKLNGSGTSTISLTMVVDITDTLNAMVAGGGNMGDIVPVDLLKGFFPMTVGTGTFTK